jgi:DNA-PKcs, CC5
VIKFQQEPKVAKTLWVSLFSGLCSELKKQTEQEQYSQFLNSSKVCLKSMVSEITGCVPLLVGAILEISYTIDDLEFDSNTITEGI